LLAQHSVFRGLALVGILCHLFVSQAVLGNSNSQALRRENLATYA
jgi:hypothetical protein